MKSTSKIIAEYVDHMGDDLTIVNAARVSFGNKKDLLDAKDEKLIKYLAKHKHMSPFEHVTCTMLIKCPLYIRSQIHRHRTFAYNEISRRYTSKDISFYVPPTDDIRVQAQKNKQASADAMTPEMSAAMMVAIQDIHTKCFDSYNRLIEAGVCREQARGILPQNMMTEFYMTGNLRNWVHFLILRKHEGAQKEVRVIADQIEKKLKELFPFATNALMA